MRIIIDADACPVLSLAVRAAEDFSVKALIYSDTAHIIHSDYAECITVDKGADSADFAILSAAMPKDIVITGDYALASMCLSKKAYALKPDGTRYTNDNIDIMLTGRYLAKKALKSGQKLPKIKKRTAKDDASFDNALRSLLAEIKSSDA